MFSRQGLLESWKEIKPYFIFSIILFLAGAVIGGSPNAPVELLQQQLKGLEGLVKQINESDNPGLASFFIILKNNVLNTILVMGMGIIAGIMPVFMLVINGMVLGYMMSLASSDGVNVWLLFVKGILPHGIFELSAVFLACAFGMRFGVTLFKGILGTGMGKQQAWQPFVRTAKGAVPAIIIVAVLLLIGAIVESTISSWLMSPS